MLIQIAFVLTAIIVGARLGGVGLGVTGGIGLGVLTFLFGLKPTQPPIDVMLMIAAVISAAAAMQSAGGLNLMVKWAERLLRNHPHQITMLSPAVTYLFSFLAGTGHVAYSVLPVIAEVATETGVRPSRPLGIAVIASQQAITASPISAATVAMLSLLSGAGITLWDILAVTVPSTLIGVVIGALLSLRSGKNLADDPEYQRRVKYGDLLKSTRPMTVVDNKNRAIWSIVIFIAAMAAIVMMGSVETLRPVFSVAGETVRLDMPSLIEIVMLSAAAVIMLSCKLSGESVANTSVFSAGMQAVVAIFGIAWLGDTFIQGNLTEIKPAIEQIVTRMPWLFGLALFVMSILLYSQAATVRAFMPLGIALGLSPMLLIALFPAVNGYFFIPNYPTLVAAINFDRTGSTRIGRFILNHSFMQPGLVATVVSVAVGLLLITLY